MYILKKQLNNKNNKKMNQERSFDQHERDLKGVSHIFIIIQLIPIPGFQPRLLKDMLMEKGREILQNPI